MELYKAPGDIRDYSLDWGTYVLADGETISESAWREPTGAITVVDHSHNDTGTTVWLSGGVAVNEYKVYNKITTSANRTIERYMQIEVRELIAQE